FREGVDAGHTLSLDGGDGWRPHTLQHNLTIHHQIHGLTEVLPESTEVARLLERDQIIDEEVDFGFGHIALVAELLQPECLDCQGTVHRADGRHIEQCYLALPFLVEQFAPALDRASSRLRVVTYRISVVPSGHHDDVTRRPLHLATVFVAPHPFVWSRALANARFRRQLSSLGEIGDLVPVLDPLSVAGLKRLRRLQQGQVVVVPFTDLVCRLLLEKKKPSSMCTLSPIPHIYGRSPSEVI